jgi:hypothetical protein
MNRNRPAVRIALNLGLRAIGIGLNAIITGCTSQHTPLEVQVTQLGPYTHAARAPDCRIPVLESMPLQALSQIAIVEAWADEKDQPPDVLPALQRKACETGADALVIINSRHQDIKNLIYASNPETRNEVARDSGYSQDPGAYLHAAEHTRRIGEAGHNGFYIDAVAIEYSAKGDKHPGEPVHSTVIDSIRTPPG